VGELDKADLLYQQSVTIFEAAIVALPTMKDNYTARLRSTLLEYAKLKKREVKWTMRKHWSKGGRP